MKKIFVPTDFSKISENALHYACQLAMKTECEIFLINIQSLPANDDASMAVELIKSIEQMAKERLNNIVEDIKSKYKGIKISQHFSFGIPSITIKEYLETSNFAYVVMGTRGTTGADRFLFGSVAESVSKHSPCPVIIIEGEHKFENINKIAVPVDIKYKFNELHNVVRKIVDFAKIFDAEVNWFYINTGKTVIEPIHFILEDGKKINIEIFKAETVEKGITKYCKNNDIELLIIIKRNYGLVEQLFHRNIFGEILQHQLLPIMVVHYQ
ncbi:MAG: universal stress protein [Bacteroidetes bacterium]|nr:universal stress protein [Bacteroidota bacterium]